MSEVRGRPRKAAVSFFLAAAVLAGLFFTIRGPVSRVIGEQLVGIIWEPAARAIGECDLPAKARPRILARIKKISAAMEAKAVDREQLYEAATLLSKGPWLRLGRLMAAEEKLLAGSGLSAAEKAEFGRALRRLGRLVVEDKISKRQLKSFDKRVQDPLTRALPKTLPDESLRSLTRDLHKSADDEGVAADPPSIDLGAEVEARLDAIFSGQKSR